MSDASVTLGVANDGVDTRKANWFFSNFSCFFNCCYYCCCCRCSKKRAMSQFPKEKKNA